MTWGPSSALDAAGPQAARLAHVTWGFLAVCAVVYVTVVALVLVALIRRRKRTRPRSVGNPSTSVGA